MQGERHLNDARRYHSLDAVRAVALLLGIVVHATVSFWPGFRDAHYPVSDDYPSATLSGLYFVLHIFRMSLFYVIAGFFAHLLLARLGAWGFVKNRLRRIALPFAVALLLCIPLIVICYFWAQAQLGIKGVPALSPPIPDPGPPPWIHLWFLYLLLVFYALALAARGLLALMDPRGSVTRLVERVLGTMTANRAAAIALAAPAAVVLYCTSWWIPWQGLPSPIMGLIPNFPAVLAYGSAFGFGWLLHRQASWLELLERDWAIYLFAALVLSAASMALVGASPQLHVPRMEPMARAAFSAAYNLAGWCWIFGLIGAAVRFLDVPSARWRYVADASFFVYIMHLPVSYTLSTLMMRWPLHWSIKFILIAGLTTAITFTMYHLLVRSTFVGVFLNGRRKFGGWNSMAEAPAETGERRLKYER
jgi:glucan biosynthesis protein C